MCHRLTLVLRFTFSVFRSRVLQLLRTTIILIPSDVGSGQQLLLLLGLLGRRLFRCLLLCRGLCCTFSRLGFSCLLRLCFFFRQLGSAEGLPVVSNFRYAHGRKRLAVSAQLLVLLLALVVEHQNFIGTALLKDLPANAGSRLRLGDLTIFALDRTYFIESNVSVGAVADFLHPDHVPGSDSILFTTGADHRVHTHPP